MINTDSSLSNALVRVPNNKGTTTTCYNSTISLTTNKTRKRTKSAKSTSSKRGTQLYDRGVEMLKRVEKEAEEAIR